MSHPAAGARPEGAAPEPTALLVLGMHRSGTSALSRVLSLLGVSLAEHAGIVQVHDQLLRALGSRWDDPRPLPAELLLGRTARPFRDRLRGIVEEDFAGRTLWALEDPRLCRLVPLWRDLLAELGHPVRFVLSARPAAEVAAALAKSDGLPSAQADLLWLEHQLAAERDTRGTRRAFLTFDGLMADWRATVERLGRSLGLDWASAAAEAAPVIDALLLPSLRDPREAAGSLRDAEHPWLRATYLAWEEAALGADPGPALAAIRDRLDPGGRLFFPWTDALLAEAESRDRRIARLRERAVDAAEAPAAPAPDASVSKDPTPGNASPVSS